MTDIPTPQIPESLRAQVAKSSFYAGMRILPPAEREAMFAIYAFCREVDDIADDQQTPRPDRTTRLNAWREGIAALYHGGDAGPAAFLKPAIAQFALQEPDFIAVIDGMQMDIDADIRVPSFATLDLYCDRVASAVGRLSVRVFGMEAAPGIALAHHLGRALQFTNILRDIDEDAGINRVYLPQEAFAAAGLPPEQAAALPPETLAQHPSIAEAARWLAPHARAHFAEAATILATRPQGHLAAPRLMESAYARVLAQMEATGWSAPRQRPKVAKLRLAVTALRLWITA